MPKDPPALGEQRAPKLSLSPPHHVLNAIPPPPALSTVPHRTEDEEPGGRWEGTQEGHPVQNGACASCWREKGLGRGGDGDTTRK